MVDNPGNFCVLNSQCKSNICENVLVDIQMEKFGRMIQINGDGIKILIKNVRISLIMVKVIVVVKVQKLDDLESDVVMMINVNQAYVIMLEFQGRYL